MKTSAVINPASDQLPGASNSTDENKVPIIKKGNMMQIKQKLLDTNGKIAFTQLQIEEKNVAMYDRRPMEKRADFSRYEEPEGIEGESDFSGNFEMPSRSDSVTTGGDSWGFEEESQDVSKFCSTVNSVNTCVCSNTVSRDVYRC